MRNVSAVEQMITMPLEGRAWSLISEKISRLHCGGFVRQSHDGIGISQGIIRNGRNQFTQFMKPNVNVFHLRVDSFGL